MTMRKSHGLATAVALSALASLIPQRATAQFAQYTPPGGPEGRPESRQERLDSAMEEARWHLGPVRVDPWFGVKDVGWVSSLSGEEGQGTSDLSATAGAGLRAYLPTGPKVVWAAHFLPEYVWFKDHHRLRDVNGRYGLGFFGFFNHLQLEATATRTRQLGIVTSEFLDRINARADEVSLAGELRLVGGLYLFAATREAKSDNLGDQPAGPGRPDFNLLDRTERVSRAGLRFRTRSGWAVGAGVEHSQVDFEQAGADRSNSGSSPVLVISSPLGGRLYLGLDLAYRSLKPRGEAAFVPYDGLTGSVQVSLGRPRSRLQLSLYGDRNVVYALGAPYSYFNADRVGAAVGAPLGSRLSARLFAETGRDRYVALEPGFARTDDVTAFGGGLTMGLYRSARLILGADRQEITSDVAGAGRAVTVIRAGITLGGGPSPWY